MPSLEAVVVRVHVRRIGAERAGLRAVGQAVVVGVRVQRIGDEAVVAGHRLLAVEDAVAVRVRVQRVRADQGLDRVREPVHVRVGGVVRRVVRVGLARIDLTVAVDVLVAVTDAALVRVRIVRVRRRGRVGVRNERTRRIRALEPDPRRRGP